MYHKADLSMSRIATNETFLPQPEVRMMQLLAMSLLVLISFSAKAGHPLMTDDTGLQGVMRTQLELNTDIKKADGDHSQVASLTYTYGFLDNLDGFFSVPTGVSNPSGLADISVGGKYFLREEDGTSWGLKGEMFFPTSKQVNASSNHDIALTLIRSGKIGSFTTHANLAVLTHRNSDSTDQRRQI